MALDIFIPYWGHPGYMKETVRSVLEQDSGDWLLTVVDDAYPNDEIQQFMAAIEDSRVKYIRKDQNAGITENYKTCVSLATEEVMVILGCDDILLPNYVRVVTQSHERFPEAAIIQPGVQIIDGGGALVRTLVDSTKQYIVRPRTQGPRLLSGEHLATNLMHGDWLYWPSLAFRTDKIRAVEFRSGFPIIQDLALVMDMVYRGGQLLLEPTVCFSYRRHSESASSTKLVDGSRFAGEREYFAMSADQAKLNGWTRASRAANLRLTSRAHALSLLPKALASRNFPAAKVLLGHTFGN